MYLLAELSRPLYDENLMFVTFGRLLLTVFNLLTASSQEASF